MNDRTRTGKLSEIDVGFMVGVVCARAVVKVHGQDTIFDEIVASVGEENLLAEARRSGAMRWSGLSDYVRRNRRTP